jgi:two-component system, OmpR family, response regulator
VSCSVNAGAASSGARILIVDDDPEIRSLLCDYLRSNGLRPEAVADGEAMWSWLARHSTDLIVLDLMLPGADGLTLCRALRERTHLPIVMLTARGALLDRVLGLEMGADDYLPKPFDPRELLARITVVLRRTRHQMPHEHEPESPIAMRFANWVLDTRQQQLIGPDGTVVMLPQSDYRVLRALAQNPHRTLSRDYLVEHVFGKERSAQDRAIDVCVSRLRQHLQDDPRAGRLIRTVRNAGYMLACDVMVQAL